MKNKGLLGFLFFAFAAIFFIIASTAQTATPFPIATATGQEGSFSAAFDGTNYLVGIQGDAGAYYNITAQLIDQSGNLVGPRISTGRTGGAPIVAFDGTNYLMVWPDDATYPNDIAYGQFISTSGALVGAPFSIASLGLDDIEGLNYAGGNYLLVYSREVNAVTKDSVVYGRTISTSGVVGSEITVSTGYGDFGQLNVAFDGTNFFTVWTDDANDSEVKGRFISPTGTLGAEISINASTYPSDNPLTVTFGGTNYLVVWTDEVGGAGSGEWDVFGQLVTPAGALSGGVINISSATGGQVYPFARFNGTNFLVTWTDMRNDTNKDGVCDAGEGTCWDKYGQYVSSSGALVGSEFVVNNDAGDQVGGPVTFNNGKYLVLINTVDVQTIGFFRYLSGEFLGVAGIGTHNASGTYTWDSGTGTLNMTWTSSDFTCDGPAVGPDNKTGVTVTATTMTWPNDNMTWTRTSGTAGDILGTWTWTESATGNSYTLTYNADGTVTLVGNIVSCSGVYIDAFQFSGTSNYCCWASPEYAWFTSNFSNSDGSGTEPSYARNAPDGNYAIMHSPGFSLMTGTNATQQNGIKVYVASGSTGTYRVYGGNTIPTSLCSYGTPHYTCNLSDLGYNPQNYGFTYLGESITTQEFLGNYLYYDIVTTGGGAGYTLNISKTGTGTGTVTSNPSGINCGADCTEPYTYGTMVTLTATPDANSFFAGWSGACAGTGTCTVTMDSDKSVTATFTLKITVTLVPDSPSVPRGGTLGYTVTVTNNTSTTQTFQYWTYVTLPNGSRYPTTGELFGPVNVSLNPGQTGSAHLTHGIPAIAPLGTYTYYGNVGPYPTVWDSDSFTFTVTSTATPGTRQNWELLENNLTK